MQGMTATDDGFLSTPSARRATIWVPTTQRPPLFLSTPSARRATGAHGGPSALRLISIHALREEGDPVANRHTGGDFLFLSTPSARRATFPSTLWVSTEDISIHALREEGDRPDPIHPAPPGNFYPRPPRGGRH